MIRLSIYSCIAIALFGCKTGVLPTTSSKPSASSISDVPTYSFSQLNFSQQLFVCVEHMHEYRLLEDKFGMVVNDNRFFDKTRTSFVYVLKEQNDSGRISRLFYITKFGAMYADLPWDEWKEKVLEGQLNIRSIWLGAKLGSTEDNNIFSLRLRDGNMIFEVKPSDDDFLYKYPQQLLTLLNIEDSSEAQYGLTAYYSNALESFGRGIAGYLTKDKDKINELTRYRQVRAILDVSQNLCGSITDDRRKQMLEKWLVQYPQK